MEIKDVKIYGLEESIKACRLPMVTKEQYEAKNDKDKNSKVAMRLSQTPIGEGHDNFLNGIIVQFNLTISNKMWVEMQRYHFIDFVSSTSTMHRIQKMSIEKMCNCHVDEEIIKRCKVLQEEYLQDPTNHNFLRLVYSIPSGFEVMARMTTNYRQLKTIYKQRKNHRLPEWRFFCEWIKTLPNSDLIINK